MSKTRECPHRARLITQLVEDLRPEDRPRLMRGFNLLSTEDLLTRVRLKSAADAVKRGKMLQNISKARAAGYVVK